MLTAVTTTSLKITNRLLSKLKDKVSHRDYKRTWQEILDELLSCLHNTYMVYANNKQPCPKVCASSMSTPYVYYKINMLLTYFLTSFF